MAIDMDDVLAEMNETPVVNTPTEKVEVKETVVVEPKQEAPQPTEEETVVDQPMVKEASVEVVEEIKPEETTTKKIEDNSIKIESTNTGVVFDPDQYKQFIDILNNVAKVNTDIHIKGSMIRQKIGTKSIIYSIDLSKLVSSSDFESVMVMLKEKVNLLKVFGNSDTDVSFYQDDTGKIKQQIIHDESTLFKINNPSEKVIKQTHIDPEKYTSSADAMNGNILFSINLNKYISKIKAFIESFGSAYIDIVCSNGKLDFKVQSSTKDMNATLMSVNIDDKAISFETNFNPIALISFDFDKTNAIEFAASVNMADKTPAITYRITNDLFGYIPINIYQKTRLK